MSKLKNYFEGNLSESAMEQISEQIINAKLDRDKKRKWTRQLQQEYGLLRPPQKKLSFFKKHQSTIIKVAASLLLLFSAYFIYESITPPSYLKIVDEEIENLNIMGDPSVFRKGDKEIDELRKKANLTYVDQKYAESIFFWNQIIATDKSIAMDYFYLGLCHLKKTDPDHHKAIEFFLKAKSMGGPKEEIKWALVLVYLKIGEIEKGKQLINEIIKQKTYKSGTAEKILTHLEGIH
ncbi:MAG: hypothetical protein AAFZ15_14135 [Bacteroidota bacterium]